MTEPKNNAQEEQLKATFRALAPTYDRLRFLQLCARRLAEIVPMNEGERVLDVATGTGVAAFTAADRVGRSGGVVGIDLSPDMLDEARRKAAEAGREIEFREGDATRLDVPDSTFDAVICASALFFIADMSAAVSEWKRVLKPGGFAAFSTFGPRALQPLRSMWEACLARHGLPAAALPTHRLADGEVCAALLRGAEFSEIRVVEEQLGYSLASAEDRWADIMAGIEGKPLLRLLESERERVRAEHLEELRPMVTGRGLWIDVPMIAAIGRKP